MFETFKAFMGDNKPNQPRVGSTWKCRESENYLRVIAVDHGKVWMVTECGMDHLVSVRGFERVYSPALGRSFESAVTPADAGKGR